MNLKNAFRRKHMTLKTYLTKMLGKEDAKRVLYAMDHGQPVLITGRQGATGKSTLCEVLRRAGTPAFERWAMCEVELSTPLEERVPHFENQIIIS